MKRLYFLFLLIPAIILSGEGFKENPPPPPNNPIEVVINYLNLSEEQIELWIGFLEEFRLAQRDLQNQIRPLERTLREILNSENPEPESVGILVIQIDNLKKMMKENEITYRENFELLLNAEQLDKYNILRNAFELAPLFPAFQATNLIWIFS